MEYDYDFIRIEYAKLQQRVALAMGIDRTIMPFAISLQFATCPFHSSSPRSAKSLTLWIQRSRHTTMRLESL